MRDNFAPYQPAYVGRDIKIHTESFHLRLGSIFLKSRKGGEESIKSRQKKRSGHLDAATMVP
jgi:hypothetical protein